MNAAGVAKIVKQMLCRSIVHDRKRKVSTEAGSDKEVEEVEAFIEGVAGKVFFVY